MMTNPQPLLRRGISTNSGPIQAAQSVLRAISKVSAVSILSRIVERLDSAQAVNASVCGWFATQDEKLWTSVCRSELKFSHSM